MTPNYLKDHPQFTIQDYNYFKTKGYTNKEIKRFWDRDLSQGKSPVTVNKYTIDWAEEARGVFGITPSLHIK